MCTINDIIDHLDKKGRWLESGEIEVNGKLWTYKFQQLKRKPKKSNIGNNIYKEKSIRGYDKDGNIIPLGFPYTTTTKCKKGGFCEVRDFTSNIVKSYYEMGHWCVRCGDWLKPQKGWRST
jgi:hypothetical protein